MVSGCSVRALIGDSTVIRIGVEMLSRMLRLPTLTSKLHSGNENTVWNCDITSEFMSLGILFSIGDQRIVGKRPFRPFSQACSILAIQREVEYITN